MPGQSVPNFMQFRGNRIDIHRVKCAYKCWQIWSVYGIVGITQCPAPKTEQLSTVQVE